MERHVFGAVVTHKTALFAYTLGTLLIFALSAVALPMTGLEHSWHVFLVVAVLFGLTELLSTQGRVSKGLVAAIVLMPLVRFEGATFSGAAILALGLIGHWKPALTAAALIVISLGAYGAIMSHLGLPLLPSSVLTKFPVAEAIADSQGGFSIVKSIVRNLGGSLLNPQGIFLLLMVSLMYCGWALTATEVERRNVAVVAGVASFGLCAHPRG